MALDENITSGETGHIADHATLKTEYDAAGASPAIAAYTSGSTAAQHATIHNALHSRHNALGSATTLATSLTGTSSGFLAAHSALHKAYNIRNLVLTRLPMQPGAIYYGDLTGPTSTQYRQPGALVITSRGNFGHANMVAAATAGAHVMGYFDAVVYAIFGSSDVTGRLLNSTVYGPAVPKWPGPVSANDTGDLADFRPGSVMHQASSTNSAWTKLEAVLESIVSENPHLAGFFADDLGSRSYFPNFDWATFGSTNQTDYRAGAILVLQAFRRVCDRHNMILLVNGSWGAGTLSSSGGGYPTSGTHGCSLADGGVWEHHGSPDAFSNALFGSSQWGSASTLTGAGNAFHLAIGGDTEAAAQWSSTGEFAWFVQKDDYTQTPTAPWGSFHATGLPTHTS